MLELLEFIFMYVVYLLAGFAALGIIYYVVFGNREEKKEPTCQYHSVCKLRSINEMNRTPVGMFSYKMQEYYKKKFSDGK
ncbi:MAG: hypothetical protein Q7J35_15580 [Candidatus Methanoperedens sp.]|nr:hypothetical protein [Candidatus Methanoperedens sp.]